MNRRNFLAALMAIGTAPVVRAGLIEWPELVFYNPCLKQMPDQLLNHPLMHQIWQDIDSTQVWDSHVHLVGYGDNDSGAWISPQMDSYLHPTLKIQKHFYMNAGCIDPNHIDQSYFSRLLELMNEFPSGCKSMLFAFDWFHDEKGVSDQARSVFHIPNHYAAKMAKAYPDRFEWVASIHPYRADCVEAVQAAKQQGARAIKWLPSAMGIDPLSAKCDRFYQATADANLPIISHAGKEMAVQGGDQDHGNPLRLRRALDHGLKVLVAHCASDGDDIDLDQGVNGQRLKSFYLFARMLDDPRYQKLLFADISALTQVNRAWVLTEVLRRQDWHARLLNGSDYPLPGVMPMFSASGLADKQLLDQSAVPFLQDVRKHNPLLFDFASKRLLHFGDYRFADQVFETRRVFQA